jgi:hypothetical protein
VTRADRILIAVIAVCALAVWPLVASAQSGIADTVTVVGPAGTTTRPLGDDGVLEIAGSRGPVEVRVSDGSVHVLSADCPDQTCVRTGRVSGPGSVVACIPNGVVVRVGGGDDGDFDARVR